MAPVETRSGGLVALNRRPRGERNQESRVAETGVALVMADGRGVLTEAPGFRTKTS
jgi:hypothetical protein